MSGKNSVLIIFLLLLNIKVKSQQNLVLNSGFEELWAAPPTYWEDSLEFKYWYQNDNATIDCYSYYSKIKELKIPNSDFLGLFYPHGGKNAIGFITAVYNYNTYESFRSKLIKPLEKGKKYNLIFYYKPSSYFSDYYCKKVNVLFSKDILMSDKPDWLKGIPDFGKDFKEEYKESFIIDLNNDDKDTSWRKVDIIYEAKGGEKYINFGLFYIDDSDIIKAVSNYRESNYSYSSEKKLSKVISKKILVRNKDCKTDLGKLGQKISYLLIDDVIVKELTE